MWFIRPAKTSDLNGLAELAAELGPGMTTLPSSRDALADKLERSVASFAAPVAVPESQYLLVLVDADSGCVLGCAGVYPDIGRPHGFFSYRTLRHVHRSAELGVQKDIGFLHITNELTGATEVGTLAVRAKARSRGAGRALAKSRYLLMASAPTRFPRRVIAEMRGWQDQAGRSPFWNAVGANIFDIDFATADRLSAVHGAGFIADLLPRFPLCIELLPPDARAAIGKAHAQSALAMQMLLEEGFEFHGLVDVFDAGPQVTADVAQIRTCADSRQAVLGGRPLPATARPALAATASLAEFRVALANVALEGNEALMDDGGRRRLLADGGQGVIFAVLEAAKANLS